MSFPEEIDNLKASAKSNIDDLCKLAAYYERKRILDEIRSLIQQKDSHNDIIAAETLNWALKQLLQSP